MITETPYDRDLTGIDICLQSGLIDSARDGIQRLGRWLDRARVPTDHPVRRQLNQLAQRYRQAAGKASYSSP
jgi:hypothetical protein